MHRLVKIADITDGVSVQMPDVLPLLSPDAHALQWRILDLGEVIYEERWDLNMPLIEQSVFGSPQGMPMEFQDLEAFANRTRQVIDGLFVGCTQSGLSPRRSDTDTRILERADMLAAAIDSSFWLVAAPEEVLGRVERHFMRVETVDVEAVGLSTWERKP